MSLHPSLLEGSEIAELADKVAFFLEKGGVEVQHRGMLDKLASLGVRPIILFDDLPDRSIVRWHMAGRKHD